MFDDGILSRIEFKLENSQGFILRTFKLKDIIKMEREFPKMPYSRE